MVTISHITLGMVLKPLIVNIPSNGRECPNPPQLCGILGDPSYIVDYASANRKHSILPFGNGIQFNLNGNIFYTSTQTTSIARWTIINIQFITSAIRIEEILGILLRDTLLHLLIVASSPQLQYIINQHLFMQKALPHIPPILYQSQVLHPTPMRNGFFHR